MNLSNSNLLQDLERTKSNGKILALGRWKNYKLPDLPELLNVSKNSFEWFKKE
jgi:hypothetical protein